MTRRDIPARFIGIAIFVLLGARLACSQSRGGSYYSGALEYRAPLLTAVPPTYPGETPEVKTAYLWIDKLMRTSTLQEIEKYLNTLPYGDTLKYFAKMLYLVTDDNPIAFDQYSVSAWPQVGQPRVPWHYRAVPEQVRESLQNKIGSTYPDSGRTGFILACDLIADVMIYDARYHESAVRRVNEQHMVLANASIIEALKGKRVPACSDSEALADTLVTVLSSEPIDTSTRAIIKESNPTATLPGTCFRFEYSLDWPRGLWNDEGYGPKISDVTGERITNTEYIVFLHYAGVNSDSSNFYYTINPFWGVFGNSGAMYPVRAGRVVDPSDDFGLGGPNLPVAEWKAKFRAKIDSIRNP